MKDSRHLYRRPLKAALLVALFLLPLLGTADESAKQIEGASAALAEGRREGWKIVRAIVDTKLAGLDRATFPAIADFVDDVRVIDARIEKGISGPPRRSPAWLKAAASGVPVIRWHLVIRRGRLSMAACCSPPGKRRGLYTWRCLVARGGFYLTSGTLQPCKWRFLQTRS